MEAAEPPSQGGLSRTAQRAVDAYGGADLWRSTRAVQAKATLTGALFELKGRMPEPDVSINCHVDRPFTTIEPIDSAGHVGVLDGLDVRVETSLGEPVDRRPSARGFFSSEPHSLRWDALDLTYFLGYALWNYLTLPALLMRADIAWTEIEDGTLESRFPPELPTHGAGQRHFFERESGLLVRYDYHPEVAVGKADVRVANLVVERGSAAGIPYEAQRRVLMLDGDTGEPQESPVMVEMQFRDWRLVSRAG